MKVEIEQSSNNPANDLLNVYDGGTRPICNIWQDDFCDLLTNRQIKMLENGKTQFNVNKGALLHKARQIFPSY